MSGTRRSPRLKISDCLLPQQTDVVMVTRKAKCSNRKDRYEGYRPPPPGSILGLKSKLKRDQKTMWYFMIVPDEDELQLFAEFYNNNNKPTQKSNKVLVRYAKMRAIRYPLLLFLLYLSHFLSSLPD